jgi:uncharacterized protein
MRETELKLPSEKRADRVGTTNPILRIILLSGGTLCVGLGLLGAILPVLPTTPFLLLAAALYLRSSERLYDWLTNHPFIRTQIQAFQQNRAIALPTKIAILALAWTMLLIAIFLVDNLFVRLLLVAVGMTKTVVMARIKTA